MELKFKHFHSLLLFVIPTIIITIVLFILDPPSPTILIGFIILLIAACGTYYLGIKAVVKEAS
ncbi:MAG TPA: hypothetical protein VMV49_05350 [Candidatus Deferrimicrobium sp.]|nr:hypothetical protein [Candidatus Deferrimicrobium sp.]